MLTRRHLRIKVMQSLYSFFKTEKKEIYTDLFFLEQSIKNTFSLYVLLLSYLKALYDHSIKIKGDVKKVKTLVISDKFKFIIGNDILRFISKHNSLNRFIPRIKANNWEVNLDYVNSNYEKLLASNFFKAYENIKRPSLKEQRLFVSNFYKEIIVASENFFDYLEDSQITWIDDYPVVNTFLLKQIPKIDPKKFDSLPFPNLSKTSEDFKFGTKLFKKVISSNIDLNKELEGRTPNWDSKRIAMIDLILIKMATVELMYFPEIPEKVTINEYVEISKDYSTPKSKIFINGILDKIVKDFQHSNRLLKEGKGLL